MNYLKHHFCESQRLALLEVFEHMSKYHKWKIDYMIIDVFGGIAQFRQAYRFAFNSLVLQHNNSLYAVHRSEFSLLRIAMRKAKNNKVVHKRMQAMRQVATIAMRGLVSNTESHKIFGVSRVMFFRSLDVIKHFDTFSGMERGSRMLYKWAVMDTNYRAYKLKGLRPGVKKKEI